MNGFSRGQTAALCGAALTGLGAFLPWFTAFGASLLGIETEAGIITLVVAIVALVVALAGNWGRYSRATVAVSGLVCAGVAVLVFVGLAVGAEDEPVLRVVSPGIGVYATVLGGGAMLVGAVVTPDERQRPRRDGQYGRGEEGGLRSRVRALTDSQLRDLVADLWTDRGWETTVEPAASDRGIDVRARREGERAIIQTRAAPDSQVGAYDVEGAASIWEHEPGVDRVVLVTSGTFTDEARKRATEHGVELLAGGDLADVIHDDDAYHRLEEYSAGAPARREREPSVPPERKGDVLDWLKNSPRIHRTEFGERAPRNVWFYLVVLGFLGWVVALAAIVAFPEDWEFGWLVGLTIMAAWVVLPVGIYRDAYTVTKHTDWSPRRVLYAVASVLWFFSIVVGAVYLYRRWRAGQRAARDDDAWQAEQRDEREAGDAWQAEQRDDRDHDVRQAEQRDDRDHDARQAERRDDLEDDPWR